MDNVNELYHHGVKGQKWGIRRYQNNDGTLTPQGISRYQKQMNKRADKALDRTDLTKERTVPSGTKMYRTSSNSNEYLKGSTYVSYLDADGTIIRAVGFGKQQNLIQHMNIHSL